jgi:hypothetical protein
VTNEQHNKFIAYSFLGYSAFQLAMLALMVAMFSMVFFIPVEPGDPGPPTAFFGIMIAFVSVFYLAFTAPAIVAAYALLKKKSWARMASIVAGVTSVMNVPFGTAACVYAFWFFLGENWKSVYTENDRTGSEPYQIARGDESRFDGSYETTERERFRAYEPPDWR